ncbi:hypothetical protein BC03BB108_F0002 (plasmid) [Bacillus cereus 03BB108]|nr:hypothetical protein BC03BB108_F0002 [Bacillus cereus 03BB108]
MLNTVSPPIITAEINAAKILEFIYKAKSIYIIIQFTKAVKINT